MLQIITTGKGHFKTECNTRHDKSLRKQTEKDRERRVRKSNFYNTLQRRIT